MLFWFLNDLPGFFFFLQWLQDAGVPPIITEPWLCHVCTGKSWCCWQFIHRLFSQPCSVISVVFHLQSLTDARCGALHRYWCLCYLFQRCPLFSWLGIFLLFSFQSFPSVLNDSISHLRVKNSYFSYISCLLVFYLFAVLWLRDQIFPTCIEHKFLCLSVLECPLLCHQNHRPRDILACICSSRDIASLYLHLWYIFN